MDGVDSQGSLQAVFGVTPGGVVEAGGFLGFLGGVSGERGLGGAVIRKPPPATRWFGHRPPPNAMRAPDCQIENHFSLHQIRMRLDSNRMRQSGHHQ